MKTLSIKEILKDNSFVSTYKGSEKTREMVRNQIKKIYGENEAKNYNPYKNTLTFAQWVSLGYCPKKGSRALQSITYIEKKDEKGNIISKCPRKINLFYYKSVEPIVN